jgi:hypothetical protein
MQFPVLFSLFVSPLTQKTWSGSTHVWGEPDLIIKTPEGPIWLQAETIPHYQPHPCESVAKNRLFTVLCLHGTGTYFSYHS